MINLQEILAVARCLLKDYQQNELERGCDYIFNYVLRLYIYCDYYKL